MEKHGQNATARAIGLSLYSLHRYLKGVGEPTQATLEAIAAYFKVTVAWLRGEDEAFFVTTMGIPAPNLPGIVAEQKEDLVLFRFQEKYIFSTSRNKFCTETMILLGKYFSQPRETRKPEETLSKIEDIWNNQAEDIYEFQAHDGNKVIHINDEMPPKTISKEELDDFLSIVGGEIIDVIPIK